MRLAEHVARLGKNYYRDFKGKYGSARPLRNPSYRREDNIKIDPSEIMEASERSQYKGIYNINI
jgi:hypothetical protein